jgi:DNA-binding IscR family transcriptional regulator
LGEILRAVRNSEENDDALLEDAGSPLGHKVVRPLWLELQGELLSRLDEVTMDDLCNRADLQGILSEGRNNLDFSI